MGNPEIEKIALRLVAKLAANLSVRLALSREMNNLLALFVARKHLSEECLAWLREQEQMRRDVETVLGWSKSTIEQRYSLSREES